MPGRKELKLSAAQQAELVKARNRHPKPYVRERAAAILKVAAGQSMRQVALQGLTKPHEPETVSGWIKRYLQEGVSGLLVRPGAGRKPVFSPSERGRGGK